MGNYEKQPPPIRRGISLLTRAAQKLNDESGGRGEMVDASTMVSVSLKKLFLSLKNLFLNSKFIFKFIFKFIY